MTQTTIPQPTDTDTATDTAGAAARRVPGLLGPEAHFEVQQLYYFEAMLLENGRYHDWVDLMTDDVHYWAPVRTNRLRRQQALSVAGPGEAAYYDDTKTSLAWRIRRFDSGLAWSEDPPSRSRHVISNVVVKAATQADLETAGLSDPDVHVVATSSFIVYRNRLDREVDLYAGGRTDVLRRDEDGLLRIARRTILLDQNVVLSKNISSFF